MLVHEPELDELASEISSVAAAGSAAPTISAAEVCRKAALQAELRKQERKNKVRAAVEQRKWLEEKLFEDSTSSSAEPSPPPSLHSTPPAPAKPLEKLKVAPVQRKQKQRSKKAGRVGSGRSNDRKCNNIN